MTEAVEKRKLPRGFTKGSKHDQATLLAMSRAQRKPTRTTSTTVRTLMQHLDKSDMTNQDVGKRAGFHPSSLGNWRSGLYTPRITDLEAMAEVLGLRIVLVDKDGNIV